MIAAVDDETFRPGMVAVVQTAGDLANWQPHVHAMVSRGGWTRDGEWVPVPYVDEHSAELLFRHKVMRLLQDEGLLPRSGPSCCCRGGIPAFRCTTGCGRAGGSAGGGAPRPLHHAAADQSRADGVGRGGGGPVPAQGRPRGPGVAPGAGGDLRPARVPRPGDHAHPGADDDTW